MACFQGPANILFDQFGYDALGRVITATQPGSIVTGYDYDLHDNLVSVMDAENIDPLGLYESQWYLQWVPGQHMWDRSIKAFEHEQYGWGAAYLAGMVGEQVIFALTLGQARTAEIGGQCIVEKVA